MTIDTSIAALTQSTSDLLTAVNVRKATQDASMSASIALAATQASAASGSAAQALAIYGSTAAQQAAVAAAQSQASLAAGYAASAASVVTQDLSGVTAQALHRSPNAVTAMFVYDTSKDSDAGAWTEKCQNTSWFNEPLNGKWLGAWDSEAIARYANALVGTELISNGGFDSDTVWTKTGSATISGGVINAPANTSGGWGSLTTVIGTTYLISVDIANASNGLVFYAGVSATGTQNLDTGYVTSSGTKKFVFTATATTTFIRFVNYAIGSATAVLDNVSVKPVTAQTTATGDYFQLTTDGKFYKLNVTSGTTEVFRGNKAKFPKIAGIVSEAKSITIYDLTEPGRPMWMRCFANGGPALASSSANVFGAAIINGLLVVASDYWLRCIDFNKDRIWQYGNGSASNWIYQCGISSRNAVVAALIYFQTNGYVSTSTINAVAMTVLPDAPLDPATGLQVPTIACLAGETKVLMENGTTKRIDEIVTGDFVKTLEGSSRVLSFFDQGIKQTIEVVFDNGTTLICTSDHKIRTSVGWVEAGALTDKHDVVGM